MKRSEKSAVDAKSMKTEKGGGNTKLEKVGETFSTEAKAAMKNFTLQVIQNGLHSLRTQYVDVKAYVPPDPSKTHFDANPTKEVSYPFFICYRTSFRNRYKDVPCWDRTRIVLTWPPGVPGDFLHANRITHDLLESQQFICCQVCF